MDERAHETEVGRALGFDKPTVQKLRTFFDGMDSDNSETLNVEEVGRAVKELKWGIKRQLINEFVRKADKDKNAQLDFCEFLKFMQGLKEFCRPNRSVFSDTVKKQNKEVRTVKVETPADVDDASPSTNATSKEEEGNGNAAEALAASAVSKLRCFSASS